MGRRALRLALLSLAVLVVAPAPTALADDITLGTTAPGTEKEKIEKDAVYGNVYTLDQAGTTESFSAYVRGGKNDQVFVPVVFEVDASGNPTNLVAIGTEVKVDEDQGAAWITTPLPTTTLPPGQYFVGVLAGPQTNGARFFYDATGVLLTGVNSYDDPSSTFGPVTVVEGVTLSMYIKLQSVPGVPVPQRKAPNRGGYCLDGRFVDLLYGQAAYDPAYKGATPAYFVEGKGLTCDPPIGLTYVGLYRGDEAAWDFYPYYR